MARNKPDIQKVFAQTGSKIEPDSAKKDLGWIVEKPSFQFMNWIQNRVDQFCAHINDWGIPEWDSASIYPNLAWTRSTVDGNIYVSNTTPNQNKEPSVSAEWDDLFAYLGLVIGGTLGNLVTVGAGGTLVDSGTSLQDILSDLTPQGNWNANTNTPTLPGTASTGDFWIVSVAGTTDLGGITEWAVNDWAVKTATGWAKVDNTSSLTADELSGIQDSPTPLTAANPVASQADVLAIGGIPTGTIVPYGGSVAPSGYLLCQGQEISETTYAALFTVLGTAYNTGGETAGNFRPPDLQGRSLVGSGAGVGLTARTRGDMGGEEDHQLTIAEMPYHTHNYTNWTTPIGGSGGTVRGINASTETTQATGGNGDHNTMHPYTVVNHIIKT